MFHDISFLLIKENISCFIIDTFIPSFHYKKVLNDCTKKKKVSKRENNVECIILAFELHKSILSTQTKKTINMLG